MKKRDFMPFARPDIGEAEIDEVVDSLRSGWLTTGPKTRKFEGDFAEFVGGGAEALAVSSATAGLHLSLEACGVREGDEVITTPYTFASSAEVIEYLNAKTVYVDICPDTLNIDPELIEKAITPRTKAIMPVHIAGHPCDMDAIHGIARRHGLKVVEDAAHAFPVKYKDKMVGALGSECTVFSFYATKPITTGEGGMVTTDDAEAAKRMRVMRLHGIDRDAFDRYTSDKPSWYYRIVAPGYKYNMSDLMASIGIHQLKRAHELKKRRAEIAAMYLEGLKELPLTLPSLRSGYDHSWHLFIVRLKDGAPVDRNRFIEKMTEAGVGCSVHFIPLHTQPYYVKKYGYAEDDFPVAADAGRRACSLPIYTKMTDGDVNYVIEQARKILGK